MINAHPIRAFGLGIYKGNEMNYENQMKQQYRAATEDTPYGLVGQQIQMPTVGQNIDNQIRRHRDSIARLEATRASLDKANLLDLKISDLREAMNY